MADATLLLLTLGPVQDFIAAGRRTADLWAGSLLLSRLAETAVRIVSEAAGPEALLFPAFAPEASKANTGRASFPNRFLARLPEGLNAAALAGQAEQAVREEVREAALFAFKAIGMPDADEVNDVVRFVEVYWTAIPEDKALVRPLYTNDAVDYGYLYRAIEGMSGARRSLRTFSGQVESGYRCTLMPSRPAVVPDGVEMPQQMRTAWERIATRSQGRIRTGERLSAIALTKRFYPDFLKEQKVLAGEQTAFPSTSSFATADFVADVLGQKDALRRAVDGFVAAAEALPKQARLIETPLARFTEGAGPLGRLSGRLLIGDDVTLEEIQEDAGVDISPQDVADLNRARRDLLRAAADRGIRAPSRYYAVLVLDGDKMGEWLAGTRGRGAFNGLIGEARQRKISEVLDRFALHDVPRIVEQDHLGRLVYGGGDDVVALLSFETAVDAAQAVREAFRAAFGGDLAADVSAGLVLAHHLTPLQQVLAAARAAEKKAKHAGRSRLAVTALKRSGAPETAVVRWDDFAPLEAFATLIRKGHVSTGLLYDLDDLRRRLAGYGAEAKLIEGAAPMMRAEAERLFLRRVERLPAQDGRASSEVAGEAFDQTLAAMLDAAENETQSLTVEERHPFDALLDRLAVAQFLGKGGDR